MNFHFDRVGSAFDRLRQRIRDRKADRAAKSGTSPDKRLLFRLSGRRWPTRSQLKHLSHYLSPTEKKIIRGLSAVIFLSLVAMGTKYVTSHVTEIPDNDGEYVEASVGGPRFVNPILASTNDADLDIVKLVFSGLMRTDRSGELIPDLADSYEITDEGKTYTFKLKQDVRWHDGAPLTSTDVAQTVTYIKDSGWKSPLQDQFRNVTVETPDDFTVTFRLQEPFAPFLSILTVGIVPSHLWQEVLPENASRAELNIKPVGTGPFRFKNFSRDKNGAIRSYSLARFEEYYGEPPKLSGVTFSYYPDFEIASQALMDRKADGLSFLPLEFRDAVLDKSALRVYTLRLPQYTAIFFNQNKNALLKSKPVRQALALALDKDKILQETLGFNGVPVYGPILPGFVGFHADIKKYRQDLTEAAKLLDGEGWTAGEDGIRIKKIAGADGAKVDTPLSLTLTTVDAKENMTVAQSIQRQWQSLGVKVELEIVPASRIQQDKIRTKDYDALLYGEIIGPDPDPYPFWHSSQNGSGGLNLAVFNNRRVDELLETARGENDREKRAQMYREFQDILAEELPAIFLYSPTYSYAVNRKVRGIETATIFTPADRFTDILGWYVKTKRVWR